MFLSPQTPLHLTGMRKIFPLSPSLFPPFPTPLLTASLRMLGVLEYEGNFSYPQPVTQIPPDVSLGEELLLGTSKGR